MKKLSKLLALVSVLFSASSLAQWELLQTNGKATARHENGVVAHNNKVFVIGGRGVKPVDVFSPHSNTWTNNKQTPFEMHHITPISYGKEVLIVTGLTGGYPLEKPLTHIWHYNPKRDTWRQGQMIPDDRRRGGAGVTLYKDKIYIVGGIKLGHTNGTTNMVDVFDLKTQSWRVLPDAPHIRDHSNAVVVGNQLVAFGGRNTSYHEPNHFSAFFSQVNDKVDVFDINHQKWSTLRARLPIPTAGAGAVAYDNTIYYVGGEHNLKPANNYMYSLDMESGTWKKEANLVRGRHGTNAVLIDNKMYIAMGSGNKGGGPELNSVEVFQIQK